MENQNLSVRNFVLDDSELTIGRDLSCRMQLHGFGISRIHASVKLASGNVELTDLKSTFGVRVNETDIDRKILAHGDILSIGVYRFEIIFAADNMSVAFRQLTAGLADAVHEDIIESVQVIGRDESCDICLTHPLVSRHHAEVFRISGQLLKIVDNHSTNNTYVNGTAITEKVLENGDVVQVGPFRLYVDDGRLMHVDEKNQMQLDACGVSVKGTDHLILDSVSMSIHPGDFVAMLGPSGAGKSTLTKVLSGRLEPDTGSVFVNNLPMKRFSAAFASHIGYVTQENILYKELTVEETFIEQSRLRLPADSTLAERNVRIAEVIDLLELQNVRFHRITLLSGGETKRVHLGIELLSSPSLIFLDEPLAGLDPGLVRKFMQLFRKICDQGHTLVLITHTLEQINFCDRILYLDRGKLIFSGASSEICTSFNISSIAQLYENTESAELIDGRNESVLYAYFKKEQHRRSELKRKRSCSFFSQVNLLTLRYFRVLVRDTKSITITLLQAPLITILMILLFGNGEHYLPMTFYFCIAISSIWIGGIATIRDFARDWVFLTRDYHHGLSIGAYVLSKLTVAAGISCFSTFLFGIFLKLLFKNCAVDWSLIFLAGTGIFSGAVLGLCISAWSGNVGRAVALLPVMFIPQILFSGIMMPFDRMNSAGQVISHITIARPLFSMLKKVSLLKRPIYSLSEWTPLFCLNCVLIILIVIAVRFHYRRL